MRKVIGEIEETGQPVQVSGMMEELLHGAIRALAHQAAGHKPLCECEICEALEQLIRVQKGEYHNG